MTSRDATGGSDSGSSYPWGDKPWPGTTSIEKNFKEFKKNHPDTKVHDGWYIDTEGVESVKKRLKNRLQELEQSGVLKKYLDNAINFSKDDLGGCNAATSLHNSCSGAQSLSSQGLQAILDGFNLVIDRLDKTQKTANKAEVDNVDAVTYNHTHIMDLGQKDSLLSSTSTDSSSTSSKSTGSKSGTSTGQSQSGQSATSAK